MIALISFMGLWLLECSARLCRPGRRSRYAENVPGRSHPLFPGIPQPPHQPGAYRDPPCPPLVRADPCHSSQGTATVATSTTTTTARISTSRPARIMSRSEEHTSELQSQSNLVCRLLLEKKK